MKDLQAITLQSIQACCTSLKEQLPLDDKDERTMDAIYKRIFALQQRVVWGKSRPRVTPRASLRRRIYERN